MLESSCVGGVRLRAFHPRLLFPAHFFVAIFRCGIRASSSGTDRVKSRLVVNWVVFGLFMGTASSRCSYRRRPQLQQVQPNLVVRARWRRAIRRVIRVLKLRRVWSASGAYLAQPEIQQLVIGLQRHGGQLIRRQPAAVAAAAKATAVARRAFAKAAARYGAQQ